jgi:hypothetical protein
VFAARRLLVVGLVAVAVLATGCSGATSKPTVLPPLSTTPAADASSSPPTSTAAELAAGKAVVRRYYQLLNAATTVHNANALAALMTPSCTCRRVAVSTREIAKRHQHYYGSSRVVAITPAIDGDDRADVLVQYDYSAGGIKDSAGRVVTRTNGRSGVLISFRLVRTNGRWRIAAVTVLKAGNAR